MTGAVPVAFYAPMKSPRHPSPSGDRTMGRLLMQALGAAGFAPQLASEVRTLDMDGRPAVQARFRNEAEDHARELVEIYRASPAARRPRLWFTYHVHYKAPDWIGPLVSAALAIPYVIAEGSRAPRRAGGPWDLGHRGAEAALDRATTVFAMTARDREALEAAKPARQAIVDLPPFIDLDEWRTPDRNALRTDGPLRLLTVAMMRPGDKLASYRLLADALDRIRPLPWHLAIVGDGPARNEVERHFAPFGDRVRFHGAAESPSSLAAHYAGADLLVWPAVNEAYGMVLLEAQSIGCPVAAGAYGGVASVVRHGETGILTPPGDAAALAETVADLMEHRERLGRLAARARQFVQEERSLTAAAVTLQAALVPLAGAPR